ncbi:LCP family glycopolymer transferase [Ureibacillus chungkukjangi]|uniref:LytR family transcriptional attenuator n=1 Tax=Ureibacillus chungkukjangi TaxID=1202712 RepID=A0A318TVU0_9BACL|nr:LCP family protein [Ureibacillus chungkukjangi]MCM3386875.1 LCP family protein [Ureibacillus chungkukjangi]PYF06055.1 LytR family transcriptional attenuator [Ureibacillus chungkukjangi]
MKKIWKWLALGGLVIIAVSLTISYKVYSDVKETVEVVYTPFHDELSVKREKAIDVTEKEPFSALILGVDERQGDQGRSDTMIVLTVNPELATTKMLSIPRDTYTELVGTNSKDKINHAYAYGGVKMAVSSVEALLDIPIDYVAKINMESFVEIVDIVGGIEVDNAFEFFYEDENFPVGQLELDGEKALKYVRMRYDDPEGDFGRQNRQKQVIQQVLKKSRSLNTVFNYKSIMDTLENNLEMSITFDELLNIQKDYRNSFANIEQLYLNNGTGSMMNEIYYYIPNEEELKTLQDTLKTQLDI